MCLRQAEELSHEEHGCRVHLQLVALHAKPLDDRAEHRTDRQVHEEEYDEHVVCRSKVPVTPGRVPAWQGAEEVSEVDKKDMKDSNQDSEQRPKQPESLSITQH